MTGARLLATTMLTPVATMTEAMAMRVYFALNGFHFADDSADWLL